MNCHDKLKQTSFYEGKERAMAGSEGFFLFCFFFKGEIIGKRNDLVERGSFMMEKDIFGAVSLSRQERRVYSAQKDGWF